MPATVKIQDGLEPTPGEQETIDMLTNTGPNSTMAASTTEVDIWRDEETGQMTAKVVDDGMVAIAWFDTDGNIDGDWIV